MMAGYAALTRPTLQPPSASPLAVWAERSGSPGLYCRESHLSIRQRIQSLLEAIGVGALSFGQGLKPVGNFRKALIAR